MPAPGTHQATSGEPPLQARLYNVKFSPNLGDGLLSECLEKALIEHGADPSGTYSVDLGGRTIYASGPSSRGKILKFLQAMPPKLRTAIMRPLLLAFARKQWRPHYESHLADADAVVIGGGNLFIDLDMNFPIKVSSVLNIAARRRLPVAIYGVGVSANWSAPSLQIMREALAQAKPCYISVRDEASKRNFDSYFSAAAGQRAAIVRDPGLLISRYVDPVEPTAIRPTGLCITSSIALNYHSDVQTSDTALEEWYLALCKRLSSDGHAITAFTNGSPEDEHFFQRISTRLEAAAGPGYQARRVANPTELASLIGGLSFLVAHRMHALIAGYSFGVPIHALQWDPKVDAFMASVGLADRIVSSAGKSYDSVGDVVKRSAKPDETVRLQTVREAFANVGDLSATLRANMATRAAS